MKQSLLSYLITSLRGMFTSMNTSAGKHTNKEANNCPPPIRRHRQPTEMHCECKETHYEYVSTGVAEWYYFFTPKPYPLRPTRCPHFG